jgi:hypothetical protein
MKHRLWKKLNREARKYALVQTEEDGYTLWWGDERERTWKHYRDLDDAKAMCDSYRRLYIYGRIVKMRRERFKSKIVY